MAPDPADNHKEAWAKSTLDIKEDLRKKHKNIVLFVRKKSSDIKESFR